MHEKDYWFGINWILRDPTAKLESAHFVVHEVVGLIQLKFKINNKKGPVPRDYGVLRVVDGI